MNLQEIKNIFFIGIGGIGMSAIARYFLQMGKNVSGYDKTPTYLTNELQAEGINITFQDSVESIPREFLNKEESLIVITPAIPKNHQQWNYFQKNEYTIKKRAEVLGIITAQSYSLAVAGTHGKTTTSSMLAHIMYDNQTEVTAFLGGVLENYQTNLIQNGTKITVVEADEFDRSFMHLFPNIACVISTDADHLDIYHTANEIKTTFQEFANKITDPNNLFVAEHTELKTGVKVGFTDQADIQIKNIRVADGKIIFDIAYPNQLIENISLLMPGNHNILNATLAFAMAYKYGLSAEQIKKSLATFTGVRRRFSYKIKKQNKVFIDDYAHHPTEIEAVAQAIKQLYEDKKVLAIFQPHLFSRTRDFIDDFAISLSKFDEIALMEIYPARELPIEGITSQLLLDKIKNPNKILLQKDEVLHYIEQKEFDVLVTIGAGDIGEMVEEIAQKVKQKL